MTEVPQRARCEAADPVLSPPHKPRVLPGSERGGGGSAEQRGLHGAGVLPARACRGPRGHQGAAAPSPAGLFLALWQTALVKTRRASRKTDLAGEATAHT